MTRSLRRIRSLFLIVLTLSLLSAAAWAADYSAALHALHFDIALQADGSAQITETREIVFSGDHLFTRYGVNNAFTGPRTFSGWQVSLDGAPLSQLDGPDNENRPENSFAVEEGDGENTVHIYFRQSGSGARVFRISYRMENAVKLYADVGEFFWNLTAETGISDIGTLTATLTVPEGVPAEELLIWAHGPLNGNFDKQPDGSAFLQIDHVPLGTIVDLRAALPAACFTGGWAQEGEALDAILAEEKALTDSANAKREEAQRAQEEEERARAESEAYWAAYWAERDAWAKAHPILYSIHESCFPIYCTFLYLVANDPVYIIGILGIPIFLLTAIVGRLLRNRKKLRHVPAQSPRYYRDLPDHRPAPAVDRLVHFYDGKPDVSRQISSALLELNLKGLVHFRTEAGGVTLVLNTRLGEELFPSAAPQEAKAQEPKQTHTPDYQEILWRFLVSAADGSAWISMEDLKQYIRENQASAWHFRSDFECAVLKESQKQIKSEVVRRPFLGKSRLPLLLPVAAGILAIVICLFGQLYYGIDWEEALYTGLAALVETAILFVIYRLGRRFAQGRCVILEQQAEDDLAMWQAFGRFLDDFTTFADKELPEFSVWREYMVYAVAMGRGQKVARALSLKYPETLATQTDAMDDDMIRWLQDMALYEAMDSVSREVTSAREPVSHSSGPSDSPDSSWTDNWSDSSGGGGGFADSGGGSDSGSGGDFID